MDVIKILLFMLFILFLLPFAFISSFFIPLILIVMLSVGSFFYIIGLILNGHIKMNTNMNVKRTTNLDKIVYHAKSFRSTNYIDMRNSEGTIKVFRSKDMKKANLSMLNVHNMNFVCSNFEGASLRFSSFSACDLSGANISVADLLNVHVVYSSLYGANLSHSFLESAIFENTDLSRANLEGAWLTKSNFIHCNLVNSNLRNSSLSGADLSKAKLNGADLKNACINGLTKLPFDNAEAIRRGMIYVSHMEYAPGKIPGIKTNVHIVKDFVSNRDNQYD